MSGWRVFVKGWPESEGFVSAATANAARYKSFLACRDAGYQAVWNNFRAHRAPEFDAIEIRRVLTRDAAIAMLSDAIAMPDATPLVRIKEGERGSE